MSGWCLRAAVVVTLLGLAACSGQGEVANPETSAPTTSASSVQPVLSLDLDDGGGGTLAEGATLRDTSGNGNAGVVHIGGGSPVPLAQVEGAEPGDGALRFPPPCPAVEPADCPKALIEVAHSDELNPGQGDFGVGAVLRLEPDQTSKGSNIMQKGFAIGGQGEWKLQVDGVEGKPGCVVVGSGEGGKTVRVTSSVSVSDGAWHEVVCRRTEGSLVVMVDGTERGSSPVPADLSIEPDVPVRIGGKNLKPDNDQYFGELSSLDFWTPQQ